MDGRTRPPRPAPNHLRSASVLTTQGLASSQDSGVDSGKQKTITVTSTATVSTSPDIAVFEVSARGESADGSQAFELAARKGASVIRALRGAGVAEKDLTTLAVGLNRQVVDRGQPGERAIYVASNRLEVIVRDLDDVGAVLDAVRPRTSCRKVPGRDARPRSSRYPPRGRMAERTKATVLKTVSGATRSWVRIPLLPPPTWGFAR